jgi:hypothetical protein
LTVGQQYNQVSGSILFLLRFPMPESEDQPEIRKVNPASLHIGPLRRESLSQDQEERVHAVYRYLAPYLGTTLEQFEIGFLRDSDPDSEINVWLAIAQIHRDFIEQHTDKTTDVGRDVYKCCRFQWVLRGRPIYPNRSGTKLRRSAGIGDRRLEPAVGQASSVSRQ